MKTKTTVLIALFVMATVLWANSQTINYGYDASGNRTLRTISLDKSTLQDQNQQQQEFKDNIDGKDILIYPNPVESELTVQIPDLDGTASTSLQVYDQGGKLVYSNTSLTNNNTINLSGLPHGVYFLHISYGETTSRWKIVKE